MMGNNFYIKAETPPVYPSDNAWVRNSDWIDLPEVVSGDSKMYGIFAVYEGEDESNYVGIEITGPSTVIFWGDGTSQVTTSATLHEKQYIYSATTGTTSVDITGRNYRQVLVSAVLSGATTSVIPCEGTTRGAIINWLDFIIDCSTMTTFLISDDSNRYSPIMERLRVLNHSINTATRHQSMVAMRILDFDVPNTTTCNVIYRWGGNFLKSDLSPVNFENYNAATTFAGACSFGIMTEFGDISSTAATSFGSAFSNCSSLINIGDINLPESTYFVSSFIYNNSLDTVGTITAPKAENLQNMFHSCLSLRSIIFTECSGVTNTTSSFFRCSSLEELILPNITIGFDINYSSMQATEIDALYTSLGTAASGETIDITYNPGAATCDNTIATAKGWTIVG